MRHILLIFLLLVSLTSLFAQKGRKESKDGSGVHTELSEVEKLELETMLIGAERELILENYYKAYELFKAALEKDTDNAALNFKTAEVLAKNGDNQTALAYAKRASELDPSNKYYLLLLAEIHKSLANYEDAATAYQKLIDSVPGTETYLFDLALLYQYLGEDQKALNAYSRAEDYFGMNEMVLFEKQKIYIKDKNYKDLIADWDKLIAENQGEERFVIDLCEFLISQDMFDEAKSRLETLENNTRADLLLSRIALESGDLEQAILLAKSTLRNPMVDFKSKVQLINGFLELAISSDDFKYVEELAGDLGNQYPDEYEVQAFVGDVMFRIENKKEAQKYYLKAVRVNPSNYQVWQNILSIESELNQYDSLVVHAEEALEYFPNQAVFYYFAGTGHLLGKNYKKSVQMLDQGKKYVTEPGLLTVFYGQLGDAYNSLKQFDKSYGSYEKALETDPNNDHVLNNYSYFLSLRKKDLDKALKMSSKLVEMHPDNPTYLDTHGWVLYMRGEYKQAFIYLEKAVAAEADGTVIEHFGDVLFQLGRKEEAIRQWKRASGLGGTSDNIQKKIAEGKLYE